MRSATELAQELTGLDTAARQHLERLLASWGLLADFAFSDLLLYVPMSDFSLARRLPAREDRRGHSVALGGLRFVVIGQMRPTTNQTLLASDQVGAVVGAGELSLVANAWERGVIVTGDWPLVIDGMATRASCIPVQFRGEVIGIVSRIWSPERGRRRGALERAYLRIFENLSQMMIAGLYPFHAEEDVEDPPRVGDGVVVLDEEQRITFASPNAVNAFHRLGIISAFVGSRLDTLGLDEGSVADAFGRRMPVIGEVERHGDVTVVMNTIPLIDDGAVSGAAVLLRDVSDIRRRDRLLLSKDAAIREVHHRVKNNLQTISSLLRLQSRRTSDPTAHDALLEAERRIRAIAVVHEILAGEPGDQVSFDAIVPTLVALAHDADVSDEPASITVTGSVGDIDGEVATPLALVLSELLQNAVEHAFGTHDHDERTIDLELQLVQDGTTLIASVRDNGNGFPEGFNLDRTASLGLAIVRDLVRSQLGGAITVESAGGALVRLEVPLEAR